MLRMLRSRGVALWLGLLTSAGVACRREPTAPASVAPVKPSRPVVREEPAVSAPAAAPATSASEPTPRPLRRCFPELPVWQEAPVDELLDQAAQELERGDAEAVLACSEEAARQRPQSVEAHHYRAVGLIRSGRLDEAKDAVALALALEPGDVEALELAADLYINQLPPTAERTAIGLQYARRGRRLAKPRMRKVAARLALLETQALIDLGRSADALTAARDAIRLGPAEAAAHYERGVALFELCRFAESKRAFEQVLSIEPGHAHAMHHLGLIDEQLEDVAAAETRFRQASLLDPKAFPPIPVVSATEFSARLDRVVAHLSPDMKADLAGIPVQAADLPDLDDLTADKPPLSPTILGLFRGLPLGRDDVREVAGRGGPARNGRASASSANAPANCAVPERAILLYRRNILRSVSNLDEVDPAIERTLLHEIGHLRGEDDGSLRDRGLE